MDEITFSELRAKTVVNVVDGKKLGHICDLTLTVKGKLVGLILPANKKLIIKQELAKIGITEGFVYPEIEHISNSLLNGY